MSYTRAQMYHQCIEPLMAGETLVALSVSAFPQMKKENAKKLERELKKRSEVRFKSQEQNTTEDIYRQLLRTLPNGR